MMYLVSPPPNTRMSINNHSRSLALLLASAKLKPSDVVFFICLCLCCLVALPLSAITRTVGFGNGYDYPPESMQLAINHLMAEATQEDCNALLRLGPGTYITDTGYTISMEATAAVTLTIESIEGAAGCVLYADPNSYQGGFGRIFKIRANSQRDLIIKDITMIDECTNNSLIHFQHAAGVSLPRRLMVSGCVFQYKYQAIDLRDTHIGAEAGIAIINSEFVCTANSANDEYSIEAVSCSTTGENSLLNLLLDGNTFTNPGCPLYIKTNEMYAQVCNNQFQNIDPSFISEANAPMLILYDMDSGANSSMIFEDNLLLNTGLNINAIECNIQNNTFWIDDSFDLGFYNYYNLICSNVVLMGTSLPTPYIEINVIKNLFYASPTGFRNIQLISNSGNWIGALTMNFSHNTFLATGSALRIEYSDQDLQNRVLSFRDNIVACGSNPFEFYNHGTIPYLHDFTAEYCVFENGYPQVTEGYTVDENTCHSADPLLVIDPVNFSYQFTWTSNEKSPCINAGYPGENNELTDPDGTPPDIGCVYYTHYHKKYFDRPSLIKWMSFPVVDDRTCIDGQYWNTLGYMFSNHMDGPPFNPSQLNQIQWSYDGDAPTMRFLEGSWQNSNERVIQPKGYKIKFNNGPIGYVTVNGFKVDAGTTPAAWVREKSEGGYTIPFENWIGYYVPFTQKAGDALSRMIPNGNSSNYLDYVYFIKTQNWSTSRISEDPSSRWIVDPNKYTLSEGEMVSLLLLKYAPSEMYWNLDGLHTTPIVRTPTSAFTYEEKLDYTPVFIEFDPADMPNEVGLYVDGVCKGAAVVDSSLIDVCFYNEEAKAGGDLEIVFYYEGKGKKTAKGWTSYNPDSMVFENGGIDVNTIGNYAYISFKSGEGDSPVPLVTTLQPNYPNPFNPSTNISFILGKDMDARLEIYNLRGQRVKTLCNTQHSKGKYTYVWNGQDDHGRQVASGIYFSRLTTPEGNHVQKMMLTK